jgi:hypothetical protein
MFGGPQVKNGWFRPCNGLPVLSKAAAQSRTDGHELQSELGAFFMQWKCTILASELNAGYRREALRCYTLQQAVYTSCSHDRLTRPEVVVRVYPNAKYSTCNWTGSITTSTLAESITPHHLPSARL